MQPKLTISILISRNYEGVKKCLDSVMPIMDKVSSELILTDTGCGEEVRGLIKEYSDHIIDFEWIKDFSAARNAGLKEAKGEWFLYIDDDEWFDDVTELIRFFNSGECDKYNVATYVQRNYLDEEGKTFGDHSVDRILRINSKLHFEHRIHEAYTGIEIGQKKKLNTFVHHYGYLYKNEEERIAKSKRNRELLLLECEEHPEDMRMRHQLMMDYYGTKEYDEAINVALEAIKIKSDSQFWDALHTDILFCCQAKKDWDTLIDYGERFLKDNLFPYDEFGVRQYLICAYWSNKMHDKVCALAIKAIDTYRDYKRNPRKYNTNQLMRDEFWQEDKISKMLLFIIDSALAEENDIVIDKLQSHDIRKELEVIINNDTYKTWLTEMVTGTCKKGSQIELFNKLAVSEAVNRDGNSIMTAAEIDFKRLEFEPEFFEEETRDDFLIEPLIKNAWAAQLETLNLFDQICRENNLTYSMDWGSLLGAVRHKGYIPWDDDLDVCMPREDIMKLYKIIEAYPMLYCRNPYNSPDIGGFATRLCISDTYFEDRGLLKDCHGFPFPAGIDIFNIDYVPKDKKDEEEQVDLLIKANHAFTLRDEIDSGGDNAKEAYIKYKEYVKELKEKAHVEFAEEEPSKAELVMLYDELQGAYTDEDASYVTEMPCLMVGMDYYLPKETYRDLIRVPFENMMVPIPKNYDEVLRHKYGDNYMTPVQATSGHEYPFYNEFIRSLMETFGVDDFDEAKKHIEKLSGEYYRKFINRNTDKMLQFDENELCQRDVSRIQAALLETLEEIKRLCDSHNISYYYIDGTENDIDSIMKLDGESTDIHLGIKRVDYMKFQQIIQEELDSWFDYRSIYSHRDHTDMRTYIITDAYLTNEREYQERFHGCNDIVGIDIAPIDTVNDDDSVEALKKNIIATLLQSVSSMPTSPPYNDAILAVIKEWEDMLGVGINLEGNLQNELVKAADNVAMSDANDAYSRVRISPDIGDGNYALYYKSYFQ